LSGHRRFASPPSTFQRFDTTVLGLGRNAEYDDETEDEYDV
jgi:hypothetical protein